MSTNAADLMMRAPVLGKPLVSIKDIATLTGLSLPMVREMVNRTNFPAPCGGGPRTRRWLTSEVTRYWHEQSRKPHPGPLTVVSSHDYLPPASSR